jgi:adenosine deaminase
MRATVSHSPPPVICPEPSLRDVLAGWPKIDLHRHLEGSLRLSTLAEIAREHGVDLPSWDIEKLRPYVQVVDDPPGFHSFLSKFRLLRRFYSTYEAVMRVAYEAVADAASDNIKYLELRFNPVALSKVQGFDIADVAEWVIAGTELAQHDYDIQVRLIAQIGRDESLEVAWQVAQLAAAFQARNFVAIDLAGDEINYPAERFAPVFQWAKGQGLHITIHAAEAGQASNVREAIQLLGADRIGHGVRAMEDPAVVDALIKTQVPLEMCPTSNLHTGVISNLARHPLPTYQQLGIRVTINTDDPSISNTTLTDEYLVAVRGIGIPPHAIQHMILTAAQVAFLPAGERETLVERFRQALALASTGDGHLEMPGAWPPQA